MSGIVGIVRLDGQAVDSDLLRRMTNFMAFRGPDAQELWCDGPVGLGHTLLWSTDEPQPPKQPFSADGRLCITADARVDDQSELKRQLRDRGWTNLDLATDAELIVRAYQAWGEDCVQHLLGDFAFAIWDGRRKRLFCGRDHFGVKPFYYALVGECLIFSNTLNCIRLCPDVSAELNDQAIGDFLLFDFNQDPLTTAFRDIQRLPPAHSLTWSNGHVRVNRYWTLPPDGCIRYTRSSEYVDHFKELLRTAVRDRLRTNRVGVLMSGGLDSTMIAATAKEALLKEARSFDLRAFTAIYDYLIRDSERHFSSIAAKALGIPIHYLAADDYRPYERWNQPELQPPEPCHAPFAAVSFDHLSEAATHSAVALTGDGPDCMLAYPMRMHVAGLLRQFRCSRLVIDLTHYVRAHGWSCLRAVTSSWRYRIRNRSRCRPYPAWLEPRFAARINLYGRWEQTADKAPEVHINRQRAYQELTGPFWTWNFETSDPGVTRVRLEVRRPFFDRRVVEFLLAIPPVPWCLNKRLIRTAVRDMLPEQIRRRPKAPLNGDAFIEALRRHHAPLRDDIVQDPVLFKYVDTGRLPRITGKEDSAELWSKTLPVSLNFWLQHFAAERDCRVHA